MKKVKILKSFLTYKQDDIINLYSLADLVKKDKQGLLEKSCLAHCKLAKAIYGQDVVGFVSIPTLGSKESYIHVLKCNSLVEEIKTDNDFTKKDLKSGDIVILNNKQILIFVNEQIGFLEIPSEKSTPFGYKEFKWIAFNENLTHFRNDSQYDIVKVLRFKAKAGLTTHILNSFHKTDIVFERQLKPLYTLKEASQSGKRFKHKCADNYSYDLKFVLDEAYEKSGTSLLKLIELKEYELEEQDEQI